MLVVAISRQQRNETISETSVLEKTVGRTGDGKRKILRAAIEVFAESGFEGATLRQIAGRAHVQHQLAVYHFKTKEALWYAAVESLFEGFGDPRTALQVLLEREGPKAAVEAMVEDFVHFSATVPEFHRITTFEGRVDNERFRWLAENYVRPHYEVAIRLIKAGQKSGVVRAGSPGRLHYAMIGVVTTNFVFATEYNLMTGVDPFAAKEVQRTIDLACDFLWA